MTSRISPKTLESNFEARFAAAVKFLAQKKISVVVCTSTNDKYEAWERYGGDRHLVACVFGATWHAGLLHQRGQVVNPVLFSHPYKDLSIARAAVVAFQRVGCPVQWTRTLEKRIAVYSNPPA